MTKVCAIKTGTHTETWWMGLVYQNTTGTWVLSDTLQQAEFTGE